MCFVASPFFPARFASFSCIQALAETHLLWSCRLGRLIIAIFVPSCCVFRFVCFGPLQFSPLFFAIERVIGLPMALCGLSL